VFSLTNSTLVRALMGGALALGLMLAGVSVEAAATKTRAKPTQQRAVHAKKTIKAKAAAAPVRVKSAVKTKRLARVQPQRVRSTALKLTRSARVVQAANVVDAGSPSFGQVYGLHRTSDPLSLKSSVAFVLDQDTNEVLFAKNSQAVLPIASLTKLMTALIVVEAHQPLDEVLTITEADVDTEKNSSSRLAVGTRLTREEMLHLALMASENRAAHALGRHYPGGLQAFVAAMNRKAHEIGMSSTRYVEPTGLSSNNQSSAPDLAVLVKTAYNYPLLREFSTSQAHQVAVGGRHLQFRNTNGLVRNQSWDIGLQKTGYIAEAGRCLVMQARLAGRKLIMVFLDSSGKYSRLADAERVRHWLEAEAIRKQASLVVETAS